MHSHEKSKKGANSKQPLDPEASKKRKKRIRTTIIVVLVVLIALGAGGAFLYFKMRETKSLEMLDASVATIQECDAIVVEVDNAIDEEVTSDRIDFLQGLIDGIPATKEKLSNAYKQATEAVDGISSQDKKKVALAAQEASDARSEMLNYGRNLIQNDIDAFNSATELNNTYALIIEADDLMRKSAANAGNGVIADSISYDKKAQSKLKSASEALSKAKQCYPSADFSVLENYLDHKTKAASYAMATDEAIQKADTTEAKKQNKLFEAEEAKAAEAASKLPKNILQPILDAFENNTLNLRAQYNEARQRAAEADVVLRDYLGVTDVNELDEVLSSTRGLSSGAEEDSSTDE
ncbi:MAG: hypothetical protein K6G78_05650 [bacterium]|nr:hypothetical protein [bacterium]